MQLRHALRRAILLVCGLISSEVNPHHILELILGSVDLTPLIGHDSSRSAHSKEGVWDQERSLTSFVPAYQFLGYFFALY